MVVRLPPTTPPMVHNPQNGSQHTQTGSQHFCLGLNTLKMGLKRSADSFSGRVHKGILSDRMCHCAKNAQNSEVKEHSFGCHLRSRRSNRTSACNCNHGSVLKSGHQRSRAQQATQKHHGIGHGALERNSTRTSIRRTRLPRTKGMG